MTIGGKEVFTDGGLKDIIESEEILKLAYDVRMDSDALFHQHDVVLKNVLDLQLLDIAIRRAAGGIVEHLPVLVENSQSTVNQRGNPRLRRLEKTRQKHVHLRRRRRLVGAKTAHRRRQKIRRFRRLGVDEVRPSHASKRDHRATLIPWIRRKWNERVLNASRKRIDEYKDKEIPIEQGGKRTAEMTQAPPF